MLLCTNALLTCAQITYKPVFINPCTQEIIEQPYCFLMDSVQSYTFENKENKIMILPKSGFYNIYFDYNQINGIEIKIQNLNLICDTFYLNKLKIANYLSNPPTSLHLDCDSFAHGRVIDYYYNNNVRTKGTFKKGVLIDTLFRYYRNGQLKELYIPGKKHFKSITYFKNGEIQFLYDVENNSEKEFYPNGTLKIDKTWSKKNGYSTVEYYPNGRPKMKKDHKELNIYYSNGQLKESMGRKEILKMERIRDKHNKQKFYQYHWQSYTPSGNSTRKIEFNGSQFDHQNFPDSIEQIDGYLYNKVTFYQNNQPFKKIECKLELVDKELVDVLKIYQKKEKQWEFETTEKIDKIYDLIEKYALSNQ